MSTDERVAAIEFAVSARPGADDWWKQHHDLLSTRTLELVGAVKRSMCDDAVSVDQHDRLDARLVRHLELVSHEEARAADKIVVLFAQVVDRVE